MGVDQIAAALKERNIKYGRYTGKEKMSEREQLVKDYNADKVHVMLLSSAGSEGLDLKRTGIVIVTEPHWNWSWSRQSIGRAARFQSHPPNSKVQVYKLITRFPKAKMGGIELAGMVKIADDKQKRIDSALVCSYYHRIPEDRPKLRRPRCL